jgi:hypothetical protein
MAADLSASVMIALLGTAGLTDFCICTEGINSATGLGVGTGFAAGTDSTRCFFFISSEEGSDSLFFGDETIDISFFGFFSTVEKISKRDFFWFAAIEHEWVIERYLEAPIVTFYSIEIFLFCITNRTGMQPKVPILMLARM